MADIVVRNGYKEILFLGDNTIIKEFGGYPVVGTKRELTDCARCDFIAEIGEVQI